jgi:DNA (cytosine-5)-methyltransferase 1
MTAYYNDFDPSVCNWLEELIRCGLIADGVVDRRSILDVEPADLAGFTQVHFFAGIGGWSYALRLAGWPDDRPVWTGSPPCQPFSAAGKQKGRDDARHLSPKFASLVRACRPGVLFGEQVASAEVFGKAASGARKRAGAEPEWAWLDDLSDRLEAAHYAVGASDFPSAGVGAPHIRQRTFFGAANLDWLGNAFSAGQQTCGPDSAGPGASNRRKSAVVPSDVCGLADAEASGRREECANGRGNRVGNGAQGLAAGLGHGGYRSGLADADHAGPQGRDGEHADARGREAATRHTGPLRTAGGVADAESIRRTDGSAIYRSGASVHGAPTEVERVGHRVPSGGLQSTIPLHGFWANPDWLYCRDGKWRPVEPGTFPLAHGVPARVGRLRGYGNAINPHAAAQFIRAFDASVRHLRLTPMSEITNNEDIFG